MIAVLEYGCFEYRLPHIATASSVINLAFVSDRRRRITYFDAFSQCPPHL